MVTYNGLRFTPRAGHLDPDCIVRMASSVGINIPSAMVSYLSSIAIDAIRDSEGSEREIARDIEILNGVLIGENDTSTWGARIWIHNNRRAAELLAWAAEFLAREDQDPLFFDPAEVLAGIVFHPQSLRYGVPAADVARALDLITEAVMKNLADGSVEA
jgi:hypothetical protein